MSLHFSTCRGRKSGKFAFKGKCRAYKKGSAKKRFRKGNQYTFFKV